MRVHIEHREKTHGLFRSRSQIEVVVLVEFAEEELLIIERRALHDFIVLERSPDLRLATKLDPEEAITWEQSFHLRIRDLLAAGPDRFTLDTPGDAKAYQTRLTEALKHLKAFILDNAALSEPTSLEI